MRPSLRPETRGMLDWFDAAEDYDRFGSVTHWAPLPAGPTE